MTNGYRLGRYRVLPGERRVLAEDGGEAALGSRAFDLLLVLIEQRERVVTKDELMQRVWPGVVVEENNLTVQVSALRKLLGAQAVRTVSGRGYQLGMPVESHAASTPAAPAASEGPAVAADLLLPDKPSIAVLPFANLSGDPEQEYFTDGIADDLITELSRFRALFVISRASSFTYKGRVVDMRTVGRELGVRYVVEGSIRRAGARVRVTSRLVEAAGDAQIWAERYDRELEDIFAVQSEVTRAIASALLPHLQVAEFGRPERPGSLTAYELATRGRALLHEGGLDSAAESQREEGIRLVREALALDPRSAAAWRAMVEGRTELLASGTVIATPELIAETIDACRRLKALDPGDHTAYRCEGLVSLFERRGEHALSELRRGFELNPNDALQLMTIGFAEAVTGAGEVAIEHARQALRLSPRDPWRNVMFNIEGWACAMAGHYAEGARAARDSIAHRASFPNAYYCLIVCLVGLGELDEARLIAEELRRFDPEYLASRLAGTTMIVKPELRQRAVTFLRIALGLEPSEAAEGLR